MQNNFNFYKVHMSSESELPFKNPYVTISKAALLTINEFLGMKIESFAEMRASAEDEALDLAFSAFQDLQALAVEALAEIERL